MIKNCDKKRIKDLGIFYTPQEVVDFIFEILNIWKENQINRWKTKEGKTKYPSVIDPSVGEGIFLKTALAKNFTKPDWIFGLDIDEDAVKKWKEINLLKEFGGEDKDLEAHFFHQNGLEKIKWEQHRYKYRYKLKQIDIENQQFDTVVGNPPYGGLGLGHTNLSDDLIAQLAKFEIFPKTVKNDLNTANLQSDLFGSDKSFSLNSEVKQKLKSFSIEILFLERFIQLTKPGGCIAIIIPDGILTNSNAIYVREFIANKAKVEAIVSLPRDTFKNVGTNAKTSILFLRKLKDDEKQKLEYPVFLSSLENINSESFYKILHAYKDFCNEEFKMDKTKQIQITKDQNGREVVMVRVDKTLKEMMEEKPFSRWNVDYWHPKYEEIYYILKKYNSKTIKEIEGKKCVISGDHVRKSRGESKGYNLGTGIEYYETMGFLPIAYDYSKIKECSQNAYDRLKATKVMKDDILISCAGVGGVGKGKKSIIAHTPKGKSCTGDVFILRLSKINPYYCYIFLNSIFGKSQIIRQQAGTGTVNINTEQTLSILIPELNIQELIEDEYQNILKFFNKAMKAKKEEDNKIYKKNLEIAEKMLKKLISNTEAIIKGEKENII